MEAHDYRDDYKQIVKVKSMKDVSDGKAGMRTIPEAFGTLILKQRQWLKLAANEDISI